MLDRLGLIDVIDAVTSSDQAGSCKPDPAIYRIALAKAGIEPWQGLFVGDSLRSRRHRPGISWACAPRGWRPTPPPIRATSHPDTVIHALGDVLEIVGIWVRPMITAAAAALPRRSARRPRPDHGDADDAAAARARCSRSTGAPSRWVLRRAPRHASSATAHDVLREFRILDAIKDEPVRDRPTRRGVRRRRRVRRARST